MCSIDPRDTSNLVFHHNHLFLREAGGPRIWLILIAMLVVAWTASAQTDAPPPKPYATMNRDNVGYSGPGRETSNDIPGSDVTIGMILPLKGSHEAEGKAMLVAAQLALEDEAANPLPDGRRLKLTVGDESGQWGQASNEIVRLIVQNQAVALITSTNGNIAHQAEQLSNKIGVPILTLSSDTTTTEINIPWVFRVGPSDAEQSRAIARRIYRAQRFQRVLLISDTEHDGRTGGEEFMKAVREIGAPPPDHIEITPSRFDVESFAAKINGQGAEAVVLWTEPETAAKLVPLVRRSNPDIPIYLCRKAAELNFLTDRTSTNDVLVSGAPSAGAGVWVVASAVSDSDAVQQFAQRFHLRAGTPADLVAAQTYDAVRLIISALRHSGPNRARLRDAISAEHQFVGVSGVNSFDKAGNARGNFALVSMRTRLDDMTASKVSEK